MEVALSLEKQKESYQKVIQDLIQEHATPISNQPDIQAQVIFDTRNEQYLLYYTGWHEWEYTNACVLHFQIIGEKIWIHHNGTEEDVGQSLLENGVEKENIVLGFIHPTQREASGYKID
ncbi:MAG: XisI protein [Spirochaetota bacterium]